MDNAWHEWRRQGIGGSDAPVVMGVSPWKTPYQLWEEKLSGNSGQLDNSSMKRGRDLEETARKEFEKTIGTLVCPDKIIHPEISWLRANLDGIDVTGKIMVEIKCPNKDDHFVAVNRKVPEKYWPQVQHQLAVTGLDGMYYFSFNGLEGAVVEVARDQNYIDEMLDEERKFWDHVLSETPPELTDNDYVDMSGNDYWQLYSSEIIDVRTQLKALEDKDKQLVSNLKSLSQGRSAKGYGIALQKQLCKGGVDYSKVPQLNGVDLTPYRKKPFEKWPVRVI